MSLSTGDQIELIAPIDLEDEAAPVAVAISGDRVAVLRRSLPALVWTSDGSEGDSTVVGVVAPEVFSIDLMGDSLLEAFGESVTSTDIISGNRVVVSSPEGWVIGAVWADPLPTEPVHIAEVERFRVDTERVEADVDDPFLNVRQGPGVDHDPFAKLPATYTGLRRTGGEETTSDGAVWFEVELLDPVRATPLEPLLGRNPVGWVNSTFLVALPEGLPVTVAEIPACAEEYPDVPVIAGSRPPGHVYALESAYVHPRCLRVVLTFGTGAASASLEDIRADLSPSNALPDVREFMSGSFGVVVDLGGIESVWSGAVDTADGVYVVRKGETLQLWSPIPNDRSTVWMLPERGMIVVDLLVDEELEIPQAGSGVVLAQQLWTSGGTVEATGLARPFEANLDVSILDDSGDAVEVVFSGSAFLGTIRTSEYAVQTDDWVEAWAPFAVKAEGLAPGDYTLVLDAEGGNDDPRTLTLPFTIAESGSDELVLATFAEQEVLRSIIEFARGNRAASSVPFAEQVTLGLGLAEARTLTPNELADPGSWISDLEQFAGYEGGFSALGALAGSTSVRITSGPIEHCAGSPLEWPATFDGLRQINIEPVGIDSCIQWFGVSVFLNPSAEIEAVVLDLWEP